MTVRSIIEIRIEFASLCPIINKININIDFLTQYICIVKDCFSSIENSLV
jgi:hypothetical protein